MTSRILDHVSRLQPTFRPRTTDEFFGLQLARHLNDVQNVDRYLRWIQKYPRRILLQAFRRAVKGGNGKVIGRFESEVDRLGQEDGL